MNLKIYRQNIQERNAMSETTPAEMGQSDATSEQNQSDVFGDKIQREADQLTRIQSKTFTKALNALSIKPAITDLFVDLRDGKKLLDIVGHFLDLTLVRHAYLCHKLYWMSKFVVFGFQILKVKLMCSDFPVTDYFQQSFLSSDKHCSVVH